MLHTSDFDFELPPELIASHPLEKRDASRMLVVDGNTITDKHIRDFLDYLRPGDVVVFNNSRVIPARFDASGHEITLHTSVTDKDWWGLCKKFNKINIGDTLTMTDGTTLTVKDKYDESGLLLHFDCENVFDVLGRVGKMPLPPYMKREAEIADQTRYQTVYAEPLGSMAAPTLRAWSSNRFFTRGNVCLPGKSQQGRTCIVQERTDVQHGRVCKPARVTS